MITDSSTIAEILSAMSEVVDSQMVQTMEQFHKQVIKTTATQVCLTLWSLYAVALMAEIIVQALPDPIGGATNCISCIY